MDEARVGHGNAAEKQAAILPLRMGEPKNKRQPKLPFVRNKRWTYSDSH
jgi:hypothetical protein